MDKKNIVLIFLIVILVYFLFFYGLSKRDLWDPDEGRYAEIAREMIERGDYITPTLNYENYNKKPPLYFWLSVISYKLFPNKDYAPRYVSALFGTGCVLFVLFAGTRLFCFESGIFSALILLTSLEFIALSRAIVTDMILTFFITAAILSFFIFSLKLSSKYEIFKYLLFIFSGLAFMSKGPLGIIVPSLVILSYILAFRDFSKIRDLLRPINILLFLLVVLPWYVISTIKTPGFLYDNLIYENVMRYFTNVHERSGSIFYYIPVILGGF
ncbi:MAG: glycosyltransferase family 39 protein, partial [Candidatus Schekmanbacteria bacterium]